MSLIQNKVNINILLRKYILKIFFLLFLVLFSCQKFNNPYDSKYDIEKAAPKDFKIDSVYGASVNLSWEKQTDYSVNYIIDRKVDSSNWVNNYAVLVNKTEFTDTSANGYRVYYRLYLKAGTRESSNQETYFGIPVLTTNSLSNVTYSSATCGGIISDNGNLPITVRGVCWNIVQNPTITNHNTSDGTGNGSFTSNLTGLAANTTYFIRAYATNKHGTAYGNQITFSTNFTIPTVTTSPISNITSSTAISGGNVSDSGRASITVRGVCWSISQNPTITDNKTTDGAGIGSFTSNLSVLIPNTTYFVKAYATNSFGTAYGNQINFITNISLPSVTTNTISNISITTALGGGNVTNDGGANVTARGICWSTSQNPTITNSFTNDGTGIGPFISNLTGLTANTIYYIRAYATNSAGTAYSTQLSFTTFDYIPTVTTSSISNISSTTASGGGNITYSGGSSITVRGVCWSTSQNPTTASSHTSDGIGTGSFTSNLTGLIVNTTYYVKAYATNSYGTSYGIQLNFTTPFTIGLSYGGGIIFYIDGTGKHGLIAAPSDQSTGSEWGCIDTTVGITSTAINTGAANTNAIVAGCNTAGIAAKICYYLVLSSYSDWYLPSRDELNLMYINLSMQGLGGFASHWYWSSSEYWNNQMAYYQNFTDGTQDDDWKSDTHYVRAVRSF